MRIIGGAARGRTIQAPPGQRTRPTTDRVRESLFAIIESGWGALEGAAVLDLYAGSGALGLEALSRGAARATFVDVATACERAIKANAERLQFAARVSLLKLRVTPALRLLAQQGESFGLILADPPYAEDPLPLLEQLAGSGLLAPGGLLTLEHGRRELPAPPPTVGQLALQSSRIYGDTALTFYERGSAEPDVSPDQQS